MSQFVVPNWYLSQQRREQVEAEEENRYYHVHSPEQSNHTHVPMSNYEVTELTWENGQLSMHGLGGLVPNTPVKPAWAQAGDTLECVVNQATSQKQNSNIDDFHQNPPPNLSSIGASSSGKWAENSGDIIASTKKKHSQSELSAAYRRHCSSRSNTVPQERAAAGSSACVSASTTFWCETDTTMMTRTSLESPCSFKIKTRDDDSACRGSLDNVDEDQEIKVKKDRSILTKRSRVAAVHNQSERKRRDRINQKMKALQKLVPNSSKTDKASMLDEVIEYLKQLQAQVQMMNVKNMPHMMMPMGMQQQLQMSQLLARMGMGMGLGMRMAEVLDMNGVARSGAPQSIPPLVHTTPVAAATPAFLPPSFMVPSMVPMHRTASANPDLATNPSIPMHDPYCALLTQMDLYNKMAALYQQQLNQAIQATSSQAQAKHGQRN